MCAKASNKLCTRTYKRIGHKISAEQIGLKYGRTEFQNSTRIHKALLWYLQKEHCHTKANSVYECVCFSCDIQLLNGQLVLIAVLQPLNDCCCLFWLCSSSPGHKLIALFSRSFIDKRLTCNWKLLNHIQ